MKLDKRLVLDEDYVVTDDKPAYKRSELDGDYRRSRSAVKIYAPAISDDEVFLCRECEQFTSTSVQGIHAHQQAHNNERIRKEIMSTDQTLRLVAFNLLPDKVQRQLLLKARALVGGA